MENKTDSASSCPHYFRMVGNSMDGGGRRGFIDGDILHCSKVDFHSVQEGEGYVIQLQGGVMVMRVASFDGERILAFSLNPSYPEREFTKNEVQGIYLIEAIQRKVAEDVDL